MITTRQCRSIILYLSMIQLPQRLVSVHVVAVECNSSSCHTRVTRVPSTQRDSQITLSVVDLRFGRVSMNTPELHSLQICKKQKNYSTTIAHSVNPFCELLTSNLTIFETSRSLFPELKNAVKPSNVVLKKHSQIERIDDDSVGTTKNQYSSIFHVQHLVSCKLCSNQFYPNHLNLH